MRSAVLCCLLLLSASVFGDEKKSKGIDDARFQPLDVFELEYATDPQISPDGQQVVYLRNFFDIRKDRKRSNLWLVAADSGQQLPLTSGSAANPSSPRWSPDGKRLAWVSNADGATQLYCRWMAGGELAKITNLPESPNHLAWSPDGKWLAFTMRVPETPAPFAKLPAKPEGAEWAESFKVIRKLVYRHDGGGYAKDGHSQVFVVPAEGGTPKQLTSGEFEHEGALAWSPDGASLLFVSNRRPDWEYDPLNSEIYEVTLADRQVKALTNRKGMDAHPAISPDGKQIAYIGFDDQRLGNHLAKLYVMDRSGGQRRCLTEALDRSVAAPNWSRDGRGIFFQFDDSGNTWLGYVGLDGKLVRVANNIGGATIGRPYSSGSFSLSNNDVAAFTHGTTQRPADVAAVDARQLQASPPAAQSPSGKKADKKSGKKKKKAKGKIKPAAANPSQPASIAAQPRVLTHLNADLLAHKELGKVEELKYKSSADGRAMQAWIITPPGFDAKKKYPLVLEIHGGPFANYGERFSAEMQLYAAAGYVVLYCNPRGSTGYGADFANLIHHNYPGQDYDDLMSGVDAVLKRGFVDEKQLYVTGGSGGGVLTAWIVGKTGRFRAAVSAKPVINWYSFVLTSDAYPFFNQYWFPGFPWKNAEHYLKRSPLSLVGNVTTPTMLLTGEQDFRTPMAESEQFYQALKLRKIDTALVRVPGASHDIAARPSHLIGQVAHTLRWFELHKNDPPKPRVKQIVAHRGSSADRPQNTLASARRAIEVHATALEVDVRSTKDGQLVLLHDETLDHTTDGTGPVSNRTLDELKKLDAGSKFDVAFRGERIPTLIEVLQVARGKIDILLDLKETGDDYVQRVVRTVQQQGEPQRTIVGVRSVEQAREFRRLLPDARQIGLIAQPDEIEAYAAAGVETIRLWPKWLTDDRLVDRVRQAGAQLHLNGTTGSADEIQPLLKYQPESLSSDNPGQLVQTLKDLGYDVTDNHSRVSTIGRR